MYDEHDDRLDHLERTATVAVVKEAARKISAGMFFFALPLVLIPLTRGVLALVGTLSLRGVNQLAAIVVVISVTARMAYRHGRPARADRASRVWARIPILWSWRTVRVLVRRTPVTVLAIIGLAQFTPWQVSCAAGIFLLLADLLLVKSNVHRVQRLEGLTAFFRGGEKPTWEV